MKLNRKNTAKASGRAARGIVASGKATFSTVASILAAMSEHRIDGAGAWLGKSLDRKYVVDLVARADELNKVKLNKPHDQVLVVHAQKLFAWPVTGVKGDVYERAHDKNTPVRGSISLYQKHYGAAKVKLVSLKEALAMAAKVKTDRDCLKTLKELAA